MKIEGRTFVVSGGASGLGQASVEEIIKQGGQAAVLDVNEEAGTSLAAQLGPSARFFPTDVLETSSIAEAVRGAAEWAQATGKPLGGVVAAAGIGNPSLLLNRRLEPFGMDHFDLVFNVNVRGTVDLVRQVVPHLARVGPPVGAAADGERGVVVMVASVAAFEGQMGQVAYAGSKGAVASMTLPMTRDLSRYGIRVVTVAPGVFETSLASHMSDKVRQGLQKAMEFPPRGGKASEFAQLVRHIFENAMLNGAVLRLDGGARNPARL